MEYAIVEYSSFIYQLSLNLVQQLLTNSHEASQTYSAILTQELTQNELTEGTTYSRT